jgi:hypothetical protein
MVFNLAGFMGAVQAPNPAPYVGVGGASAELVEVVMAHQRPTAPRQALPLAGYSGHLQAAMVTFELLTAGASPLSVDGRVLGHGLPSMSWPAC